MADPKQTTDEDDDEIELGPIKHALTDEDLRDLEELEREFHENSELDNDH